MQISTLQSVGNSIVVQAYLGYISDSHRSSKVQASSGQLQSRSFQRLGQRIRWQLISRHMLDVKTLEDSLITYIRTPDTYRSGSCSNQCTVFTYQVDDTRGVITEQAHLLIASDCTQ